MAESMKYTYIDHMGSLVSLTVEGNPPVLTNATIDAESVGKFFEKESLEAVIGDLVEKLNECTCSS
tara:strand:+ start:472 stop:669 length:198 start_codon:yes stop_codon:yes gene_type:complete